MSSLEDAARRNKFDSVFNIIREGVLDDCKKRGLPAEAIEWYHQNLKYNVPGGKLNRGLSVVETVEILKGSTLSQEEDLKSAVLGWCIELLQAFFLISDDIMDASITRRGQPCWYLASAPSVVANNSVTSSPPYTHPLVGNVAINDAFLLEAAIYELLRKYFRGDPCYLDLLELFHDCTYRTEQGQLVDLITAPEGVVDLGRFSPERHRFIVEYKTAYYSFYLPVAAAMRFCNVPDSYIVSFNRNLKTIRPYDVSLSILLPIGEYFQIQDDFLDYAAPPEVLGKIGTDIVDNKCSWCINTALSRCTPEQRLVLEKNYGRKGDLEAGAGSNTDTSIAGQEARGLCEKRVKDVYDAIDLRQIYSDYEEQVYKKLTNLINSIPEDGAIVDEKGSKVEAHGGLKRVVFKSFLDKIYRRNK